MLYKFYKAGTDEMLGQAIAGSLKEAEEKVALKVSENVAFTSEEEAKKTRKPRSDKGAPRKVETKGKQEKTRRKPEYFVFNGELSQALNYKQALDFLSKQDTKDTRIIQGHEIKFSTKVTFHLK